MYEKRLTAFIDILGFKDIIDLCENDSKLVESIYKILTSITSENSKFNALVNVVDDSEIPKEELELFKESTKEFVKNMADDLDIKITHFSDCLVYSVPIKNEMACFILFEGISKIMVELHRKHKILIRGGISIGNLIHDEHGPLFGKALVDAYEIESKKAINPHVLIDENTSKGILRTERHKIMLELFEKEGNLLSINLASAYFHLITISTVLNKAELVKNFYESKKNLIEMEKKIKDEKTKAKYLWLIQKMEKRNEQILKFEKEMKLF